MPKRAIIALLLAAACGGEQATTVHSFDAAAIDTLPELRLEPGQLVCTATGYAPCPLNSAFANHVGDGRIALWEPGRQVMLLQRGDSVPRLLGHDGQSSGYGFVVSVTSAGRNRYRLITADGGWRVIEMGADGAVTSTRDLQSPGLLSSIGYVGDRLVLQRITGWADDTARFVVERLRQPGDTTGEVLLTVPLAWLRGGRPDFPIYPLIGATPVWTIASDGDLVWSPGDRLVVERRSNSGRARWRIEGGVGPAVTEADLDARLEQVRLATQAVPLTDDDFTLMRERSDSVHPAVTGITVTQSGTVYLSGAATGESDSVRVYRIAANGTPNGKFAIGRRTRILLAEGDSMLVHQPAEGEPLEVRWMKVSEK